MRLDAIAIGKNPPDDVNVVVEVPLGGEPIARVSRRWHDWREQVLVGIVVLLPAVTEPQCPPPRAQADLGHPARLRGFGSPGTHWATWSASRARQRQPNSDTSEISSSLRSSQ